MPDLKKQLVLNKFEYTETHLSLVNCLLPVKMTPMEITVLAHFMVLDIEDERQRFDSPARAIVKKLLDLSTSGLSNYVRSLIKKKFLIVSTVDNKEVIIIWSILIPQLNEQMYMFKLVNRDFKS